MPLVRESGGDVPWSWKTFTFSMTKGGCNLAHCPVFSRLHCWLRIVTCIVVTGYGYSYVWQDRLRAIRGGWPTPILPPIYSVIHIQPVTAPGFTSLTVLSKVKCWTLEMWGIKHWRKCSVDNTVWTEVSALTMERWGTAALVGMPTQNFGWMCHNLAPPIIGLYFHWF